MPIPAAVPSKTTEEAIVQGRPVNEPLVEPRSSEALSYKFWRRTGVRPEALPYVAPHPWLYRPFLFLLDPTLQSIDTEVMSAICFLVARDNACRFCFGNFWASLRMAGYSEADLDRLEGEMYLRDRSPAEQEALRTAVQVSRGPLQGHDQAPVALLVEEGLAPRTIREVVGAAALGTMVNRVSTMLGTPAERQMEEMTSSWYFDLIQPVVGPLLRGWQSLSTDTPPLHPNQVRGPLARWTGTLEGTSLGTVVQSLTDQWYHHTFALPLRTKLLTLAVVAKGLHCDELEATARVLLRERTSLSEEHIRRAVNHLGGEQTSASEAHLLQLARASIRFESTHIRRAARRFTRTLSRDETIDAVASIGLANALGRLRVLFQLDD